MFEKDAGAPAYDQDDAVKTVAEGLKLMWRLQETTKRFNEEIQQLPPDVSPLDYLLKEYTAMHDRESTDGRLAKLEVDVDPTGEVVDLSRYIDCEKPEAVQRFDQVELLLTWARSVRPQLADLGIDGEHIGSILASLRQLRSDLVQTEEFQNYVHGK